MFVCSYILLVHVLLAWCVRRKKNNENKFGGALFIARTHTPQMFFFFFFFCHTDMLCCTIAERESGQPYSLGLERHFYLLILAYQREVTHTRCRPKCAHITSAPPSLLLFVLFFCCNVAAFIFVDFTKCLGALRHDAHSLGKEWGGALLSNCSSYKVYYAATNANLVGKLLACLCIVAPISFSFFFFSHRSSTICWSWWTVERLFMPLVIIYVLPHLCAVDIVCSVRIVRVGDKPSLLNAQSWLLACK